MSTYKLLIYQENFYSASQLQLGLVSYLSITRTNYCRFTKWASFQPLCNLTLYQYAHAISYLGIRANPAANVRNPFLSQVYTTKGQCSVLFPKGPLFLTT